MALTDGLGGEEEADRGVSSTIDKLYHGRHALAACPNRGVLASLEQTGANKRLLDAQRYASTSRESLVANKRAPRTRSGPPSAGLLIHLRDSLSRGKLVLDTVSVESAGHFVYILDVFGYEERV